MDRSRLRRFRRVRKMPRDKLTRQITLPYKLESVGWQPNHQIDTLPKGLSFGKVCH